MSNRSSLNLTSREIEASFKEGVYAEKFPPILTIAQAAELLQIPVGTLRDWRSHGLLDDCCTKTGKHIRFHRDRFMKLIFNDGLRAD
ncbi:Helix-turn-helix domain protein [Gimesia panareensis]|uniref:Helix-turn-helix domain protein n=2 Tax=Gimesia panareensis TaxID=2527978 RepID=A0A518FT18_9PLAN|nr:Helix-turn-helix domain protein [Gimesia panareensis]QDV20690.1 Helix-turn-helix domain protein [Gimesia panareensis]